MRQTRHIRLWPYVSKWRSFASKTQISLITLSSAKPRGTGMSTSIGTCITQSLRLRRAYSEWAKACPSKATWQMILRRNSELVTLEVKEIKKSQAINRSSADANQTGISVTLKLYRVKWFRTQNGGWRKIHSRRSLRSRKRNQNRSRKKQRKTRLHMPWRCIANCTENARRHPRKP